MAKKAVIFDLGRVLFDYDEQMLTSFSVSDPEECRRVSEVVFDRLYWDRLDKGTIEEAEIFSEIDRRLPKELAEKGKEAYTNWPWHLPEVPGIRALVEELHDAGVPIYVLSNISIYFAENYRKVPHVASLLNLFDGLVFSGPVHLVKPDPAIFTYILEKYGLKAEECVFIDDNPNNTSAAETLGITTWQFRYDVPELTVFLHKMLKTQ